MVLVVADPQSAAGVIFGQVVNQVVNPSGQGSYNSRIRFFRSELPLFG